MLPYLYIPAAPFLPTQQLAADHNTEQDWHTLMLWFREAPGLFRQNFQFLSPSNAAVRGPFKKSKDLQCIFLKHKAGTMFDPLNN
jgi:hypothetical protein